MKRLVDTYEKKAQSSKNSATSHAVDHVRDEIGAMLDGAEEGSDEHYYATQLLKKKENRDVFITLKTPNGRLNWLRRAWEDQKNYCCYVVKLIVHFQTLFDVLCNGHII